MNSGLSGFGGGFNTNSNDPFAELDQKPQFGGGMQMPQQNPMSQGNDPFANAGLNTGFGAMNLNPQ